MTWETWTNGLNQSEISCKLPGCNPEGGWSIWQYFGDHTFVTNVQGWLFLIFTLVGIIAIIVGFCLISTGYLEPETKPEEKKEPEKISKGKRK